MEELLEEKLILSVQEYKNLYFFIGITHIYRYYKNIFKILTEQNVTN